MTIHWEKQHSVHQWTIRLTLELDAFRKKMPTWLKLDKSMTKLASEWVDNRPLISPQEKLKTILMQNFGGTTKSIMVFFKKGLLPCELPQASPWINLKVPGKKHTNFPNFLVDNKSEESGGKLVLKNSKHRNHFDP